MIYLDTLRAITRSKEALKVLADEIATAPDPRTARLVATASRLLADPAGAERNARPHV